jgi:hypothetical protein
MFIRLEKISLKIQLAKYTPIDPSELFIEPEPIPATILYPNRLKERSVLD